MKSIAIVGAGISGCVVARKLAERGCRVTVFEANANPGGLAEDRKVEDAYIPLWGPHIFRTSNKQVYKFINRFCKLSATTHRVRIYVDGSYVVFPPDSIKKPATMSIDYYASLKDILIDIVGPQIYCKYYEEYTQKKLGVDASYLAPQIISLIPLFNHKGRYFSEIIEGIPEVGYVTLFQNMLDHKMISTVYNLFVAARELHSFDYIIWSGRIDEYFDYCFGELFFASVRHEISQNWTWPISEKEEAVINFPQTNVPYIRATNYQALNSVPYIGLEYPLEGNLCAYPILTSKAVIKRNKYIEKAESIKDKVSFIGRQGRFEYSSMDRCVLNALKLGISLKF